MDTSSYANVVCLFRDLIDSVVAIAENTADELIRNQGQEVILEEDPQLQLPFLLPEDRYSCEVIRGVPPGLKEFLNPLAGIGQLVFYLEMIIIIPLTMASLSGGGCLECPRGFHFLWPVNPCLPAMSPHTNGTRHVSH